MNVAFFYVLTPHLDEELTHLEHNLYLMHENRLLIFFGKKKENQK